MSTNGLIVNGLAQLRGTRGNFLIGGGFREGNVDG